MSYASVHAIRSGAGLLFRGENETPNGTVNGANTKFTVKRRPIVDSNDDDTVTVADVTAFVDGSPVTVSAVDAVTGEITLAAAPTTGKRVTVDYSFSSITDAYVTEKQLEADSWIDLKIGGYVDTPITGDIPGIVVTAAELYASGLILTRDWGSRVDSELTSKDGFGKIKLARELIKDYIEGLKQAEKTKQDFSGKHVASASSDHDVFSRHQHELRHSHSDCDDGWFMRRD